MNDAQRLFLFVGRTASGKETQSKLLAEKIGAPVFMTGERFREIIRSGTPLGLRIKDDYDKGLLMPSWVADYMFQDFVFNLPHESSAVFEGSGRDVEQAEMIQKVCSWLGRPYVVFNLEVSPKTVITRSLARSRDTTDQREVIETRLKEYERLTAPAIERFKEFGTLITIDGEVSPEEVHEAVLSHIQRDDYSQ